jgi:MFS transporter, DHA2 family, multidrug resistance protein
MTMDAQHLFYKWVPSPVRITALLLLYFAALNFKGVYQGNTTDVFSGLGVYAEPYMAAYNAVYIGMGLGLMIHRRLRMRFSARTLLLWGFTFMLLLNGVCGMTSHPAIVIAACLALGFTKVAAMMEVYLVWLFTWSRTGDRSRVYPFVYFLALSGTYFLFWWMTRLAALYSWRHAYISVLVVLLFCLLLVLLFVEHRPPHLTVPLYQMDWTGAGLLAAALMLVNYIVTYGRVEDWLNSGRIKGALVLLPVCLLGFVLREMTVRRPLFDLRLFRRPHFWKGLLLLGGIGIFLPGSLQFLFTDSVLHYELVRSMELNLYMIPGIAIGAIWSFFWFYYKRPPIVLFCTGLLAFVISYVLLYNQLVNDLGLGDFWLLSILKGLGTVLVYIVLGLYAVKLFPPDQLMKGIGVMVIVRSFLGTAIFSGAWSYFLYAGRVRHFDYLAGLTDPADRYRLPANAAEFLQRQSDLAAVSQLTGIVIFAGMALLVVVLAVYFLRRIDYYSVINHLKI